jgi:hypothetical protein
MVIHIWNDPYMGEWNIYGGAVVPERYLVSPSYAVSWSIMISKLGLCLSPYQPF